MKKFFNDEMTSSEAQGVLFSVIDGKSKDEIEEIKKEFFSVISTIRRREAKETVGYMTNF